MKGVVLCGGQSIRMGSDKGLMKYESLTWLEMVISKLAESVSHIVLSVNSQQYLSYSEKFRELATIVKDNEALDVYGPLKGILSVHLKYPSDDLLVVACDMLLIQTEVLEHLIFTSEAGEEDAFVFKMDGQVEPFCAVYRAKGLIKTFQRYKQGQLKKHSLRYMLENIETRYLSLNKEWKKCFTNFNSPDDLSTL